MALDLTGVMVAAVTPFTRGGAAVDHDWIPPHLRFLEQAGISSVFTLGTNGEGPSVGVAERRQIVETVVAHKGGLGVVAGAGTAALPDTIQAANDALEAGADAVAILPPFFEAQVDSAGLLGYFDAILAAVPAPGRLLLYNIPHKAQVDIPDDVVLALLDRHGERVIGIKDSSGIVERTSRYLAIAERFPTFTVLAGADARHDQLYAAGCKGAVTGLGNAVPHLVLGIQTAHRGGRDAGRVQRELERLRTLLAPYPALAALKQLIGVTAELPVTCVRPPQRDLTAEEQREFEAAIVAYLRGA